MIFLTHVASAWPPARSHIALRTIQAFRLYVWRMSVTSQLAWQCEIDAQDQSYHIWGSSMNRLVSSSVAVVVSLIAYQPG
jgi:hypothetical protein